MNREASWEYGDRAANDHWLTHCLTLWTLFSLDSLSSAANGGGYTLFFLGLTMRVLLFCPGHK